MASVSAAPLESWESNRRSLCRTQRFTFRCWKAKKSSPGEVDCHRSTPAEARPPLLGRIHIAPSLASSAWRARGRGSGPGDWNLTVRENRFRGNCGPGAGDRSQSYGLAARNVRCILTRVVRLKADSISWRGLPPILRGKPGRPRRRGPRGR